jgi:hypothetical protein
VERFPKAQKVENEIAPVEFCLLFERKMVFQKKKAVVGTEGLPSSGGELESQMIRTGSFAIYY